MSTAVRTPPQTLEPYRQMQLIRVFETEAERQYKAARIGGYCHLSSGQEATNVGVVSALEPGDLLVTGYRCHGFALARKIQRHDRNIFRVDVEPNVQLGPVR